jgi:hypothetical protein
MPKFPFPNSGGGGAIDWHKNTLNIDVCVRMRSASGILSVRALLAHASLSSQILQADSRKRLLAPWFVPPIVIPIMLVGLILAIGLYRAYS